MLSQITRHIHRVVEDSHDCDSVGCDAEINYMPLDNSAAITWSNVATRRGRFRRQR
jgi:hypothetical protein